MMTEKRLSLALGVVLLAGCGEAMPSVPTNTNLILEQKDCAEALEIEYHGAPFYYVEMPTLPKHVLYLAYACWGDRCERTTVVDVFSDPWKIGCGVTLAETDADYVKRVHCVSGTSDCFPLDGSTP